MKRPSTPSLPRATARPDGSEGPCEHQHRRRTRSEDQHGRDRPRGDRALEKRRERFLRSLPIIAINPDGALIPFSGSVPGRLRFDSVDAINRSFRSNIVLREAYVPKLPEVLAAISLASKRIPISCFTAAELHAYAVFSWFHAWRFAQTIQEARGMTRGDRSLHFMRILRERFGLCASEPVTFLQWFGKLATARFAVEAHYPDEVHRAAEDLSQCAAAVYGHLADCGRLAPARVSDTIEACFVAEATLYHLSKDGDTAQDAVTQEVESFRESSAKYSATFAGLYNRGGFELARLLHVERLWCHACVSCR